MNGQTELAGRPGVAFTMDEDGNIRSVLRDGIGVPGLTVGAAFASLFASGSVMKAMRFMMDLRTLDAVFDSETSVVTTSGGRTVYLSGASTGDATLVLGTPEAAATADLLEQLSELNNHYVNAFRAQINDGSASLRIRAGTPTPKDAYDKLTQLNNELSNLQRELSHRNSELATLTRDLASEKARSDDLLLNVLPGKIADRLKRGEGQIADAFEHTSVLFADLVGFTPLAGEVGPGELVQLLNAVFTAFDDMGERLGVEKIKTIGDAYLAAAGLPEPRPDHAEALCVLGGQMLAFIDDFRFAGRALSLRVGVHSGPVVAGIIGRRKFAYDLWGDTVNIASRMESSGVAGRIQVSDTTAALVRGRFDLEPRGAVEIKGKGPMNTWLVRGLRA